MEERRLILAFALSFAVLIGFRMWTNSRYPQTAERPMQALSTPTPAEPEAVATATAAPAKTQESALVPSTAAPRVPAISGEERRVELATPGAEIAFSSKGARLLSWKLLGYKDPRGKAVEAHPGGNPIPGPLDLVTGKADVDSRLREALFRVTDLSQGPERGARFDFSDGALEARKTIQKHVVAARLAIERGAGVEVIEQAIQQIASAAAILKGPQATDIVIERLRAAR